MSCLVERDYDNLVHILSFSKLREHPTVEATKKIEEATGGEKTHQVSGPARQHKGLGPNPLQESQVKPDGFPRFSAPFFFSEKILLEKNVRKGRRS